MNEYEIGKNVVGTVNGITKYGIFMNFENGYTGMVHISEASDKYIKDLKKIFVVEETIKVKILDINESAKRLTVSIKQAVPKNRKKRDIPESGRGFEPLQENLENWIIKKMNEISEEKNKQM